MLDSRRRGARGAAVALALMVLVPQAANAAQPRITSGPARPSAETTARFTFTASMRAQLRCRLDRARARRCTRSATYRALAEGSHVFSVSHGRARATYAWTIDLKRPPRPVLSEAPGELSAAATASFAFSDAEPGVALHCRLDDGPPQPCTSPLRYEGLGDGAHRVAVVARDAAGNTSAPATHGWTVDTQAPPAPAIVAAAPALTAATGARFELSGEPGARLSCRLDGRPASCDGVDGLAEGAHVFAATAVDAAGNESAVAEHRWTIDATAPSAPAITAKPQDRAPRAAATFSFTGSETFICRLDDAPALPCTSPRHYPGPLSTGQHTFVVLARDAAGNLSPAATAIWAFDPGLYREAVLGESVGYWRFGEAAWAPAADERGARPGAYSGGVALGAAGAIQDDPDTAAAFDGISGEALLPGPVLSSDGTLEGWFHWRAGVAVLRDHSGAGGWILAYDSGDGIVASRAAGRTFSTGVDVSRLRDGWHHLVLTKTGRELAFYLDSVQVATATGAGNGPSVAPWHVMNNGTVAEQNARGRADEVAIYSRPLSPLEVLAHYRLGRDHA